MGEKFGLCEESLLTILSIIDYSDVFNGKI